MSSQNFNPYSLGNESPSHQNENDLYHREETRKQPQRIAFNSLNDTLNNKENQINFHQFNLTHGLGSAGGTLDLTKLNQKIDDIY